MASTDTERDVQRRIFSEPGGRRLLQQAHRQVAGHQRRTDGHHLPLGSAQRNTSEWRASVRCLLK